MKTDNVLSVPAKALRFTPEKGIIGAEDKVVDAQGEHKLWTRQGNTFKAHAVTVGISNGVMTEITGGISEGDVIITGATSGKMPGDGASASQGDSGAQKESSPFMPSRPGSKKK